jgi:hypothetical protein
VTSKPWFLAVTVLTFISRVWCCWEFERAISQALNVSPHCHCNSGRGCVIIVQCGEVQFPADEDVQWSQFVALLVNRPASDSMPRDSRRAYQSQGVSSRKLSLENENRSVPAIEIKLILIEWAILRETTGHRMEQKSIGVIYIREMLETQFDQDENLIRTSLSKAPDRKRSRIYQEL